MDLLDRLLRHDAWTTGRLLDICADLTDEQLDREFDIGHRTVRATLLHIIRNVEVWTDLVAGPPVRADEGKTPSGRSVAGMKARLDRGAAEFAGFARAVADLGGWDERWLDHLDDPPAEKTFGGAIAHVITHSMHHRAQLLYLLRRLGVPDLPEGDVLSWERQALWYNSKMSVWEQFFLDFFDDSADSLGVVVYAWGCREGWLQGELYRAGWRRGLRVNEYAVGDYKKADLCCLESPRMVAEIKVLGADYQSKMRYALDDDVERLRAISDADIERYMLLVIPNSEVKSTLGDYLETVCYSPRCIQREYPEFGLRLWRLEAAATK